MPTGWKCVHRERTYASLHARIYIAFFNIDRHTHSICISNFKTDLRHPSNTPEGAVCVSESSMAKQDICRHSNRLLLGASHRHWQGLKRDWEAVALFPCCVLPYVQSFTKARVRLSSVWILGYPSEHQCHCLVCAGGRKGTERWKQGGNQEERNVWLWKSIGIQEFPTQRVPAQEQHTRHAWTLHKAHPAEQHSQTSALFAVLAVPAKHVFMVKHFVESEMGLEAVACLYINRQRWSISGNN